MDEILTQYTASRFFRETIDEYNPLAIFLTGSRAMGLQREDSDYDICMLVDVVGKPDSSFPDNFLQYVHKETGRILHYFTRGLQELFINKAESREIDEGDQYLWKALIELGVEAEPLYIREDFRPCWERIYAERRTLAKASLYEIYKNYHIGEICITMGRNGDWFPNGDLAYALMECAVFMDETPSEADLSRYEWLKRAARYDKEGFMALPKAEKEGYLAKLAALGDLLDDEAQPYEADKAAADKLYKDIVSELTEGA